MEIFYEDTTFINLNSNDGIHAPDNNNILFKSTFNSDLVFLFPSLLLFFLPLPPFN